MMSEQYKPDLANALPNSEKVKLPGFSVEDAELFMQKLDVDNIEQRQTGVNGLHIPQQNSSFGEVNSRRTSYAPSDGRNSNAFMTSSSQPRLSRKEYNSLFILTPRNPIRRAAKFITESKAFEYFILLAILFTCIMMAFDAPLPEDDESKLNGIVRRTEYYSIGIFCAEALLKIISQGFALHPRSYLRSFWNILDFIVVVTSVVTMNEVVGRHGDNYNTKWLRAARVLRPLKLISGIPSLQVVMTSVLRAMFPLLQVLLLVIFVIIIYAIIGLEFMYERYHYSCKSTINGSFETNPLPCDPNIEKNKFYYIYGRRCPATMTCSREWTGLNYGITSFDNIFLSMITVFQCVTMEGWTDIMYNTFYSMDEHGYLWTFYYISLIVIGSFFMLNLVLGVLSGEFAKEREKVENRRAFLKLRQDKQLERIYDSYMVWMQKGEDAMVQERSASLQSLPVEEIGELGDIILNPATVLSHSPFRINVERVKRPSKLTRIKISIKRLQIKLRAIVEHKVFFWMVMLMVFINTIIIATIHHNQPAWLEEVQDYAELAFVGIFTLEVLIKLCGIGCSGYFKSLFNIFDLVVILLSVMEIVVDKFIMKDFNLGFSVLRSLRLLRVFKVTKYWSSLRNLVASLMNAMKSILSLMFLLFLFIVISALLGMQLFGGKFVDLEALRTNFDTFPDSLLAVFQIITGEDWNTVMYSGVLAYGGPKSVTGLLVSLYFIFLVIFGNYTLLNVFLAIAVDNLTNAEILTYDEESEQKNKGKAGLIRAFQADRWLNNKAMNFVAALQGGVKEKKQSTPALNWNIFSNKAANHDLNGQGDQPVNLPMNNSEHKLLSGVHGNSASPVLSNANNAGFLSVTPSPTPSEKFHPVQMGTKEENGDSALTERHLQIIQKKWLKIMDNSGAQTEVFVNRNHDRRSSHAELHLNRNGKTDSLQELSQNGIVIEDVDAGNNSPSSETSGSQEDEGIEDRIRREGMLNIMRVNVTPRKLPMKSHPIVQHNSLFLLSKSNRLRMACHWILNVRYFDWFIIVTIVLSSITLAIEDPVDDQATINHVLSYFDYIFTVVFGVEVLIKVIDMGFILHKGSYMRDYWNVLDAFVFACNVASIIVSNHGSSNASQTVKALRVLRVLRPIKAIHKVKKLKAVFQCMVYSLKNVTFVLIITYLILFMFGCIGVQLYRGRFFFCSDPSKMTKEECQGSYYDFPTMNSVVENKPTVKERVWERYKFNFDNILNAVITLYTTSTGEGWPSAMHHTIDATEPDRGPVTNSKPQMAIFYIVFVVLFTFMIINIYIALIILTFQRQGENQIEGGLDRNQRDCLHFALSAKPRHRNIPADKKSFCYRVWYMVDSKPFDYVIMTLIILNTIQLMMKYDGYSESYADLLMALNIAFTSLFCIEALLKIIAYRKGYFKQYWNLFDLLVIFGSVMDIILTKFVTTQFIDPTMFRLCRAARIVKLLRKRDSIRVMLWTFVQSFKALPYVTALILLLFYIYAVVGMQTFGNVKLNQDGMINGYNNFRTIIQALQLLFRSSTGENWNSLMTEYYTGALCDPKVEPGETCGNTVFAVIYFLTFIFFSKFLLLNLFVAVIMDNFEYLTRDSSILGPHHLDGFLRCWSEFDPDATGKLHHNQLYDLMTNLEPPTGLGKKCPRAVAYKRLIRMNMPVDEDQTVTFHATLLALIRQSLDIYIKGNMFENNLRLKKLVKALWPKVTDKSLDKFFPKSNEDGDQRMTVGKIYCVKLLVMNYRTWKEKQSQPIPEVQVSPPTVLKRLNSILPSLRKRVHKFVQESSEDKESIDDTNEDFELRSKLPLVRRRRAVSCFEGRSTTSEFSDMTPRNAGNNHDHQNHKGNAPKRRSSWSDIPSFFRFGRESSSEKNGAISATDGASKKAVTYTTPITMAATGTTVNGGAYNKSSIRNLSPSATRTSGLRMHSKENGHAPAQCRSSIGTTALQIDPISSKRESVRYHHSKIGLAKSQPMPPSSAPGTPKSGFGSVSNKPERANADLRHKDMHASLPGRGYFLPHPAQPVALHRRTNSHPINSADEVRGSDRYNGDQSYLKNNAQYLREPVHRNDSRPEAHLRDGMADNRFSRASEHGSWKGGKSDDRQELVYRSELSRENLETFNHCGDMNKHSNHQIREINLYQVDGFRDDLQCAQFNGGGLNRYSKDAGNPLDPKVGCRTAAYQVDPRQQDKPMTRSTDSRSEGKHFVANQATDAWFRPIENFDRNSYSGSNDIRECVRPSQNGAGRKDRHSLLPRSRSSLDLGCTERYVSEYTADLVNGWHFNASQRGANYEHQGYELARGKVWPATIPDESTRRNGVDSPRKHHAISSGHNTPRDFQDEDLLNNMKSQQYFDTMISQINNEIARASSEGNSLSALSPRQNVKIFPSQEEDENSDWC